MVVLRGRPVNCEVRLVEYMEWYLQRHTTLALVEYCFAKAGSGDSPANAQRQGLVVQHYGRMFADTFQVVAAQQTGLMVLRSEELAGTV